jgi:signal transduction histidine kinase
MKDILTGVYFLYGLSFYTMGLAIAMQYRSYSTFRLAHSLSLLAAFGVLHGLGEWGNIFIPIQIPAVGQESVWKLIALQRLIEAISYLFLFTFGMKLATDTWGKHRWVLFIPVSLFSLWLVNFLMFIPKIGTPELLAWFNVSEVWARYLLALPGGLAAAYALALQTPELKLIENNSLVSSLWIATGAFIFFGFFGGLLVPDAPLLPAMIINVNIIYNVTGIRVELLRAVVGFVVTFFITKILAIFDIEKQRRLDESYRRQAVLLERERFGRDLHDDVLQHLYGIGISIQSMSLVTKNTSVEVGEQMDNLSKRLGNVIHNIRGYITGLQPEFQGSLDNFIKETIANLERNSSLIVDYSCQPKVNLKKIKPEVASHLSKIFLEGIHNAVKHAEASVIEISIRTTGFYNLFLSIRDNGKGFCKNEVLSCNPKYFGYSGNGLQSMEARARLLNADFNVESNQERGTEVTVTIPNWQVEQNC